VRIERVPPVPGRTSAWSVLLHLALLAATAVTTTVTGAFLSVDVPLDEADAVGALLSVFAAALTTPEYLASGLLFSFTLLVILGAHELGHYFACRYYGVDASLPFFIPAPPPVLIGTLGAFIKIRSPFPNRRSLFDVGVAGPIAGFCFAIPASVVGLALAAPASGSIPEGALVFNDPLLFRLLGAALDVPPVIEWNPVYFAAWVGMFATGLNLIPVGQLDGGHAVAALVGLRGHRAVSICFFAVVTLLALVSFIRYQSPVWFLFVVILALLAFRKHPPTLEEETDIGPRRRIVAALVAVIFVLTFMPFPITVG
jgi:membrane-associated protease RseP (regulator of RpoE activity)